MTTPPPALVLIGGGPQPTPRAAIDIDLLHALPRAQRVLAVGDSDGALGRAYRQLHPGCEWLSIDAQAVAALQQRFDLIVISDGLQRTADPLPLLEALARLAEPTATLVASVANTAQWSMLERIVEADLSDAELPLSPSSIYKLLMDAGWMPTLAAQRPAATPRESVVAAARAMADALGVPRATAEKTLGIDRLVIEARRTFGDLPAGDGSAASFTVVVPTTREGQLRRNVERSPGLREVDARIVSYRRARNPAQALEQSLPHCDRDWVLLCHQDVYFPRGFGLRLDALLAGVPREQRAQTLIGFAGMGVDAGTQTIAPAGFVIDRLHRADHPESNAAVSIDELAIVVSRDSLHRIDPAIGWHLWATELCLAAICRHKVLPRIVRLPLFHNSHNDFTLPQAFHNAAAYLARKYPDFGPIPTLCGTIDERFLAQQRSGAA